MNLNKQTIVYMLGILGLGLIDNALTPFVHTYAVANPGQEAQEATANIVGELEHMARKKTGFAVDFAWPFVAPYLAAEVAKIVPGAYAAIASLADSVEDTPVTTG